MKKKVLSVLLSTAMIASVLAGCGGDSATPAADGGTTAPAADSGSDTSAADSGSTASGDVQEIT